MDLEEAYRMLEVAPGATEEEARDARKLLAKVWHPDRHANDAELQKKAERKLANINSAYKVLRDAGFPPARRAVPKVPSTTAELAAVARMAAARSASLDAKATAPPVTRAEASPPPEAVAAARASAAAAAARSAEAARARLAELEADERQKAKRAEARPRRVRWLVIALVLAVAGGGAYLALAKPWRSSGADPQGRTRDDDERPMRPDDDSSTRKPGRTIGLGASESDLRAVFGEPRSISEAFGHWEYDGGTVYVKAGRVVGWWLRDAALRRHVHLEPSDAGVAARARDAGTFCVGSTRDEVVALEGTPDQIDPTFHSWHYGTAQVTFDARGKVSEIWPPDGRGLHACRR